MIKVSEKKICFTGEDVMSLITAFGVLKALLEQTEYFEPIREFVEKFGRVIEG